VVFWSGSKFVQVFFYCSHSIIKRRSAAFVVLDPHSITKRRSVAIPMLIAKLAKDHYS
jgi:hypothetical protein